MVISCVILTKNEEKNIKECIDSVKDFVGEIIVVDDFSEDATYKIAEKLGAKVFERNLNGDFSAQRNFGLSKTLGNWVFFLDADERVSEKLKKEVVALSRKPLPNVNGYFVRRVDYLWGKKLLYGETSSFKVLRLAKKDAGKWERRVHEKWKISGKVDTLKNPIFHYPHPSLKEFIDDVNMMSTLHSFSNREEKKKSDLGKIIFWPLGKFINNYVLRLGFLDGSRGFIAAMIMGFHSFLAWSKLWIIQKE